MVLFMHRYIPGCKLCSDEDLAAAISEVTIFNGNCIVRVLLMLEAQVPLSAANFDGVAKTSFG